MNQAGNQILYSPRVLLAAGMMWYTCSLATRVGHRRLPNSTTSARYKNKNPHIFLNTHTCTTFNRGLRKLFRRKLLNYLLQKTFKVNFSHMKPPTLNSSGCDWWMSCVFGGLSFFVLFFTELYDRSLHELEYRWRLSRPLSAGGVVLRGCLPVLLPWLLPEQNIALCWSSTAPVIAP